MDILKVFLNYITQQLVTTVGGFWGKVIGFFSKYVVQFIVNWAAYFVNKAKRDKEQKAALEELKKVDADPAKTPEEIGKEYEKFINTGHN